MSEQLQNTKTVTGSSGITAGNDVSIGDVKGQLAIGDNNNQIMLNIEELSAEELIKLIDNLEQKRKEAVNQQILSSYTPSTLPDYPTRLREFVIINRLEELNKALIYLQNHRILLFTGIGGVGKTTLTRALIELRPANVPTPFWFDFRQNEDAKVGDILEKLAAYMNSPYLAKFREEKREAGKKDIDKLTDKLHEGKPVWLIFDNLETILDDIDFHDENLDLLFSSLRNNTHQAKIIITSRISPKLRSGEYLVDLIEDEKQDIKGLKINFAVDYLVKNGLASIKLYKLEKIAKGVDGYPLALKLLVGLVNDFGEEIVLEDLSIYKEEKYDTILKARKLFDKLVGDEKELLERISVYREPVGMNGLKEMFTEMTSLNYIKKLVNKSLLETDHKSNYWLHPLVQEFAYEDLENKIEAHRIACKYYLSLPLSEIPAKKEDVKFLIEAHHHACMAKEYDEAFQIIFDNKLQKKLDLWGNYTVLIDLYSKMLPRDHFGNEVLLEKKGDHGLILRNLGTAYQNLGELRKAIGYYEQALEIAKEIGDKRGESANLGKLGNICRKLGELRKAIGYYEQALEIAKEIGDKRGESADLGSLGQVYSNLGETRRSIEYYEQALEIAKAIRDKRGESADLGGLGKAYNNLGELRKAIGYYEQALEIAKEIGDKRGEGADLGGLGSTYYDLGETRKAIGYYEQALEIAKEIGDKRGESADLGSLGLAYGELGETKRAIEYYEQALEIAKEIGDKRGEGTDLGNLGLAYSDIGEIEKAIEYCNQAHEIAKEIGDKRGEGNSLKNLGKAYGNLGEVEKAIDYFEQALSIGKEIEDPKIIDFCEKNLEALKNAKE